MSSEVRRGKKTWTLLGVLAVLLLFGLPLFHGLALEDLHNDEAIYSYAVDRILEGGNWLTPETIPGSAAPGDPGDQEAMPFLEKPPLKFWIVALPIRLGLLPHHEFGLRFWDALFGLIAFVYLFLIGRRLVDPVLGLAAVFLLFIQWWLLFRHGVRANVMEASLLLAYVGGIHHFLAWSESDRRSTRWLHILAFAGWLSLGFMTKFLAVIFLPMVVGLAALGFADWRRRLRADMWCWLVGALVASMLIVPWFAYEHALYGAGFWQIIFGEHIYNRMRGALDPSHLRPWYYYFYELHLELSHAGAFGWVIAGAALWTAACVRRRWKGGFLILIWYLVPVGIISMSAAKIYHYTFPFLPAVALVGAYPVSLLVRLARGFPASSAWVDAVVTRARLDRAKASFARLFDRRTVRRFLVAGAAASFIVWLATALSGPIRLELSDVVIFSNSSIVRPLIVGVLCLLALLPVRYAVLAPPLALFLYAWPVQQYGVTLARLGTGASPLSSVRDCLVEKFETLKIAVPSTVSKIYVHLPPGEGLTHNYYYYYRVLDEWERLESPSDAELYARLFVPGRQAPTFILEEDYELFLRRLDNPELSEALRELAAERQDPTLIADDPSAVLRAGPFPDAVRILLGGTSSVLVILPGPLASCVDVALREGAERFEVADLPGPWRAAFFENRELSGLPKAITRHSAIDFNWGLGVPLTNFPEDNFSIRWDTCLTVDTAVTVTFQLVSDDGSRLLIDGRTIIDHWGAHPFSMKAGVTTLTPGVHHVEVQYSELNWDARIRFSADKGLLSGEQLAHPTPDPALPCGEIDTSQLNPAPL